MSNMDLTTPPIVVRVGGTGTESSPAEPTIFYVQADLMTQVSFFFRAALEMRDVNVAGASTGTIGFKEAHTRTVELPEVCADDFKFFLQWLHVQYPGGNLLRQIVVDTLPNHGGFGTDCKGADWIEKEVSLYHPDIPTVPITSAYPILEHPRNSFSFGPLIRLYLLADRLCVTTACCLKDDILDHMRDLALVFNTIPNARDIQQIWKDSPDGSLLRKLMLDLYRGLKTRSFLKKSFYGIHADQVDDGATTLEGHSIRPDGPATPILGKYSNESDANDEYPIDFLDELLLAFMSEAENIQHDHPAVTHSAPRAENRGFNRPPGQQRNPPTATNILTAANEMLSSIGYNPGHPIQTSTRHFVRTSSITDVRNRMTYHMDMAVALHHYLNCVREQSHNNSTNNAAAAAPAPATNANAPVNATAAAAAAANASTAAAPEDDDGDDDNNASAQTPTYAPRLLKLGRIWVSVCAYHEHTRERGSDVL